MSLIDSLNKASENLTDQHRENDDNRLFRFPDEGNLLVLGDIHGNYQVMNNIFKKYDIEKTMNNPENYLLFLGDLIDRGRNQLRVLEKIATLIIDHPKQIIVLRGNHEGPDDVPVSPSTLMMEIVKKHNEPEKAMQAFKQFKSLLYNAAIIPEYAFLVHGYIPTTTKSLDDIADAHKNHPADSTLIELLWNDPGSYLGDKPSFRKVGHYVGEKTREEFLDYHDLDWVIRGHERVRKGYRVTDQTFTLHTTGNRRNPYLVIDLNEPRNPMKHLEFLN
jgi:predicted phosphodiesterase